MTRTAALKWCAVSAASRCPVAGGLECGTWSDLPLVMEGVRADVLENESRPARRADPFFGNSLQSLVQLNFVQTLQIRLCRGHNASFSGCQRMQVGKIRQFPVLRCQFLQSTNPARQESQNMRKPIAHTWLSETGNLLSELRRSSARAHFRASTRAMCSRLFW